jgi:hypothetical protein
MPRYDRQYDFGLRGYRQTTRPMMDERYGRHSYDFGYRPGFDERAFPQERLANRVTARYNRDYVVGNRGDRYERNEHMYGADHPARMGDDSYMRRPYYTQGGTRTMRGIPIPFSYDYPDFRGRYPEGI